MTVGALLDAGAPWEPIHEILKGMDTGATYAFEQTKRHGIRAGKFKVAIENVPNKHRHLHHVFALIDKAPLSDRARANAKAVFQKLGESEAAVHGVSIEKDRKSTRLNSSHT